MAHVLDVCQLALLPPHLRLPGRYLQGTARGLTGADAGAEGAVSDAGLRGAEAEGVARPLRTFRAQAACTESERTETRILTVTLSAEGRGIGGQKEWKELPDILIQVFGLLAK